MEQRPEQARVALDHVRAAARSVLSEMQAVLTVLRDPGDGEGPAEPAPGLGHLDGLLDRFRTLGLSVDLVVSGVPAPLPAAVDLVAYRVVQESLTNVRKHGGRAAAEVRLEHRPSALGIVVTNSGGRVPARVPAGVPAAPANSGFGLIGMRERVNSVGGELRAAPTADGGFVVTATLPFVR
jgi:signal transduction histidine kinase